MINGKLYIGQTIQKPSKRWNCHRHTKIHSPLYNSIKFHGIGNFKFEIIAFAENQTALDAAEDFYIKLLNTQNPDFGYNQNNGGKGHGKTSDETKQKQSLARLGRSPANKGKPSPFKGIKRDPEIGRKISEKMKGRPSKLKGTTRDDIVRAKISKANKGRVFSEERKLSKNGQNSHLAKLTKEQVLEIRKLYNEQKEFYEVKAPLLKKLCELFGVTSSTIMEIVTYKSWRNI